MSDLEFLDGRGDAPGHERVPAVCTDDQARSNNGRVPSVGDADANDAAVVGQDVDHAPTVKHLDAGASRSVDEHPIDHFAMIPPTVPSLHGAPGILDSS